MALYRSLGQAVTITARTDERQKGWNGPVDNTAGESIGGAVHGDNRADSSAAL
jgi:hypothetical protein